MYVCLVLSCQCILRLWLDGTLSWYCNAVVKLEDRCCQHQRLIKYLYVGIKNCAAVLTLEIKQADELSVPSWKYYRNKWWSS